METVQTCTRVTMLLAVLLATSSIVSSATDPPRKIINKRLRVVDSYPASHHQRVLPSSKSGGTPPSDPDEDCAGDWGQYSLCDAQTGQQTRTYTISTYKKHAGADCPYTNNFEETKDCDVDCVGNWGQYSPCDAQTGQQTRAYTISIFKKHAGAACDHDNGYAESRTCQHVAWDYMVQKPQWGTPLFQQRPLPNSTEMKLIACPIGMVHCSILALAIFF